VVLYRPGVPLVLQNKEYGENYQDKTLQAVPELFFAGDYKAANTLVSQD
jgi:hypothetical protein